VSTLSDLRADREHWSYSSINQFVNICSLQWAFQRLYNIKPEFTPVSLSYGSAIHRALEWINLKRMEKAQVQEKEVGDLFADVWQRQQAEDENIRFDEDANADALRDQGRGLATCYLQNVDPEEEILSVNQAFAVPIIDAHGAVLDKPLIGEFDTVVRKDGKKMIVDWKTSATRWPKGKPHRAMQPTVYLYASNVSHNVGPRAEFRYDIIVKNKSPVFEQHITKRNQDQFNRMTEKVKMAESIIASEHFTPNDEGMYCKSCPYQSACKSWHRDYARVVTVGKGVQAAA